MNLPEQFTPIVLALVEHLREFGAQGFPISTAEITRLEPVGCRTAEDVGYLECSALPNGTDLNAYVERDNVRYMVPFLRELEWRGYLRRENKRWSPTPHLLPLLSRAAAGQPVEWPRALGDAEEGGAPAGRSVAPMLAEPPTAQPGGASIRAAAVPAAESPTAQPSESPRATLDLVEVDGRRGVLALRVRGGRAEPIRFDEGGTKLMTLARDMGRALAEIAVGRASPQHVVRVEVRSRLEEGLKAAARVVGIVEWHNVRVRIEAAQGAKQGRVVVEGLRLVPSSALRQGLDEAGA